jgi:tight adherence protein B
MDVTLVLFAVLTFVAVVLSLEGLYNLWASKRSAQARRIAQRLAVLSGDSRADIGIERARERDRMPWFQAMLDQFDTGRRLTAFVRASGLAVTAGELIVISGALAFVALLLPGFFGKSPVFGPVLALILGGAPWFRVARARNKRVARFEFQFPEALDLMCRAMRAGHALPTAVKMVGEELNEPLGRDFRVLSDEMNYGVPIGDALMRMAGRIPLSDVTFFVVAVMIQRESGGNLAELLEKISQIVRERIKLMGEVRTLSAEGRLSAIILVSLPVAVALIVNLVNPEFMSVLWTDPLGLKMVGVSLFMMLIGIIWMRSVIRIRV